MQRKQYQQLAGVIREIDEQLPQVIPYIPQDVRDAVMEHVAARIGLMLARDNPAFDSFRFYAATGIARFRDSANLPSR